MNLSYNNQDTEVKLFNFETNNNNQLMKVLAIIIMELIRINKSLLFLHNEVPRENII